MNPERTDLLEDIIARNYQNLTKSGKKLADYILKNPEDAAFLSSAKLGKKVNVSESTVIRFSTELGLSGFPELQRMLQDNLKEKIKPSDRLKKLKKSKKSGTGIYDEIFKSTIRGLNLTQENIRPEMMGDIVDKVLSAKKVYVVGFRRTFSLAYQLSYDLSRILHHTVLVESNYGLLFDKAIEMGREDLCIGISFSRYSALTFQIMEFAKKNGCAIIAITDSLVSPIAQIADHVLVAKYDYENGYSFPEPRTIAFVLIDCLVAEVARKQRKSIKFLEKLESDLSDYNTWLIKD